MGQEKKRNLTIADVAEALGVSRTTVSRAISGKGRVGSATTKRVLEYIEKHHYKPNVIAKGLAQSKTYNICVVMPEESDVTELHFFRECMFGIQKIAGEKEYDILLVISPNKELSSLERVISNRKVDGVILMRTYAKDVHVEYLQSTKVPFVTIGSSTYKDIIQVDFDHRGACKDLTTRLLNKGLKRIALLGGDENQPINQMRAWGYRDAYEEARFVVEEELLHFNLDNCMISEQKIEALLAREIDGILCMDDAVCGSVLRILKEKQIPISDKITIASCYNSMVLQNHVPAITTINFDANEVGKVACNTLLHMIEKKDVIQKNLLPYQLV